MRIVQMHSYGANVKYGLCKCTIEKCANVNCFVSDKSDSVSVTERQDIIMISK